MRILIVDDHSFLRRGIKEILEEDGIADKVGEAATAGEAMTLLHETEWDIVLLDLGLPDRSGVDLLKETIVQFPNLPVLIVSTQPEEQYALRLLADGARGYLSKETAPDELVKAVRSISQGRRYISKKVAELMADKLNNHGNDQKIPPKHPHQLLSKREYEVFIELAIGRGLTEIADPLNINVKTVSTYRSRVMKKMGMKSNAELTIYASKHKLINN